ncbi:hypothetical protein BKA70DRAFT_1246007 [Coprinopsis sp. MPI-PUGE-AT-0042]|nr:hypothetical protein BKA70DRAFT_1246007 [Coprinopsis sp. MPI-PUGE-AT-0042]
MSGENPFSQWGGEESMFSPSIYGALPLGLSTPVPYNVPPSPSYTGSHGYAYPPCTSSHLQILSFRFESPAKTILNSVVIGADHKRYYTIATHAVGNTVIVNEQLRAQSASSTSSALAVQASGVVGFGGGIFEAEGAIEWQRHSPYVSMLGVVARQAANQWLISSPDKRYRSMTVKGRQYNWIPSNEMICLYSVGQNPSEFVARIVQSRNGNGGTLAGLDITHKAVQEGLLDACVLAATLFISGRKFD